MIAEPTFDIARAAGTLRLAEEARVPIAPLSTDATLDVDAAYAVQRINIDARMLAGESKAGHKVGLTSLAMQKQLGVDQPDFGVITDRMVIANGGSLSVSELIAPRVEAEFAFRIGSALPASPTLEQLRAAVDGVAVALEIIDSRIAEWKITLVDTIADNASSARVVYGPFVTPDSSLLGALPDTVITLHEDGDERGAGPGSAVLGDPLVSLHWLASALASFGDGFEPGDVVLAGAVAAAIPLTAGATYAARAEGFGPVSVRAHA